jgi:hypothetical protein
MDTHCVGGQRGITVGANVGRLSGLDVFVVGRNRPVRHFEAGNSSEVDIQSDVVHTFAHFPILCTLWPFPNAPVFVAEVVSSSVRIITNAGHALWEPVVILNIPPSNQKLLW